MLFFANFPKFYRFGQTTSPNYRISHLSHERTRFGFIIQRITPSRPILLHTIIIYAKAFMSKPFYFAIPTIPLICYFRPITIIPYHYKRIINKTNNFRIAPIIGPMEINIRTPPHAYASKRSQSNDKQSFNFTYHRKASFATNPKPGTAQERVTKITRKYTLNFIQNQSLQYFKMLFASKKKGPPARSFQICIAPCAYFFTISASFTSLPFSFEEVVAGTRLRLMTLYWIMLQMFDTIQ